MINYLVVFILSIFFIGCKSYSAHPIDEASIIVNEDFLGMWRAVEDSNKKNFIFIQNFSDVHFNTEQKYGGLEQYLYHLKRTEFADDTISFYKSTAAFWDQIEHKKQYYFLTWCEGGGKNASYSQWHSYISKVKGYSFLNVSYWHVPTNSNGEFYEYNRESGYLLLRLIKADKDSIITALVTDTTLKYVKSSVELKKKIEANIDNPSYYSDTLHFYKTDSYHFSLSFAMENLN